MATFIPGLALSELFYHEAVRPVLAAALPRLRYSAALIGTGSEVLGFDTEISSDHDWGPRVILFLAEEDASEGEAIHKTLGRMLPRRFRDYLTDYQAPQPAENGPDDGVRDHSVKTLTLRSFFRHYFDFDIRGEIEPADWLTFPEQKLRTVTAGAVFRDEIGLQAQRDRFAYYPRDVWLYLLAAGWTRVGQEQHLMGRAGSVGDEIGSALIGSRLVRDLIRLCFLIERQYAPYPKWFGTAFARLACAAELSPILLRAQLAGTWPERERQLTAAYEHVAAMQNALAVAEPVPAKLDRFFDRPFMVLHGGFPEALCARITDPAVQRIAGERLIGSIDQFSDSTDLLCYPCWRRRLRRLYEPEEP